MAYQQQFQAWTANLDNQATILNCPSTSWSHFGTKIVKEIDFYLRSIASRHQVTKIIWLCFRLVLWGTQPSVAKVDVKGNDQEGEDSFQFQRRILVGCQQDHQSTLTWKKPQQAHHFEKACILIFPDGHYGNRLEGSLDENKSPLLRKPNWDKSQTPSASLVKRV